MSTNQKTDPKFLRSYERGMLRSAFASLFWSIFKYRKAQDGITLQAFAREIPANKAQVSRWFNGDPNWTVNTIASVANALDVDLQIKAVDRKTGIIFTPSGIHEPLKLTHIPRNVAENSFIRRPIIRKMPVGARADEDDDLAA